MDLLTLTNPCLFHCYMFSLFDKMEKKIIHHIVLVDYVHICYFVVAFSNVIHFTYCK